MMKLNEQNNFVFGIAIWEHGRIYNLWRNAAVSDIWRLQTADCGLRIADCRLQTADRRPQTDPKPNVVPNPNPNPKP